MYGFTHAIYRVYPTYVGMIRRLLNSAYPLHGLFHACGNATTPQHKNRYSHYRNGGFLLKVFTLSLSSIRRHDTGLRSAISIPIRLSRHIAGLVSILIPVIWRPAVCLIQFSQRRIPHCPGHPHVFIQTVQNIQPLRFCQIHILLFNILRIFHVDRFQSVRHLL